MNELNVDTSTHSYSITIGDGIRHRLKDFITKKYSSILVITDDHVASLYLDDIIHALKGERIIPATIPSGEGSKSIEYYYKLQTIAMENQLDRNSLIIALGGGVVGDIAGFVAATYMRGIDFIQMPTTILAHDSSVGGIVAINHELGKNMIGAFYPPQAVIYDIETLKTLNKAELISSYAELIKEAFISEKDFLNELLNTKINELTDKQLSEHLYKGIKIKSEIVEADEKESNVRKYLNLGHTLSHAIESELGYGKITHGEAVAIGMIFALKLSNIKYNAQLPNESFINWLKINHYPLNIPLLESKKLIKRMKSDKKSKNQIVQMILLETVGNPRIENL